MTRPKRIFDEETIRRIRAALESGANLQDLAGRFQVSKMYFVRAGLTRRKINPPPVRKKKRAARYHGENWRHWRINAG